MTFDEFYTMSRSIIIGDCDSYLDNIENSIRERRKALAPKIWEFSVGDEVRYNSDTNPQYLRGAKGKIVKINRTKVVVRLDQPVGRFQGTITTPLTLIEKVTV